jgi:hypothetical protein
MRLTTMRLTTMRPETMRLDDAARRSSRPRFLAPARGRRRPSHAGNALLSSLRRLTRATRSSRRSAPPDGPRRSPARAAAVSADRPVVPRRPVVAALFLRDPARRARADALDEVTTRTAIEFLQH